MNDLILETSSDRVSVSSFFPSPHSGCTAISPALSKCSSGSSRNYPISMTDCHQVTTPAIFSPYLPCYKKPGSNKNRKNRKMRIRKQVVRGRLLLQCTYFYFTPFLLLILTINNHYKCPIRIWLKKFIFKFRNI